MRQRRAPPKRSVLRVIELGNQSIEFPFIRFQFKFLRFMRFLKKKVEETELMWGINAWVRDQKFMRGYILMMIYNNNNNNIVGSNNFQNLFKKRFLASKITNFSNYK